MAREHIHFVTGRLAEHSLREIVARVADDVGFDYSVEVLNITVAALMTAEWIAARIHVPPEATRVLVTGYCRGHLGAIEAVAQVPVECGPKDIRDLPEYFGRPRRGADYGRFDIEIIAEINHAPDLPRADLLHAADRLRGDGADVIDVGCNPGQTWEGIGPAVAALCEAGHRVSVDSFNTVEVAAAVAAGAELVLSVNAENRRQAVDWGVEVVAVPDAPGSLEGLAETADFLSEQGVPFRLDPVLEPIGFGFAGSLGRYLAVRAQWPEAAMMMGIGNLTELTDVDSAGVNVLLLGFCQELGIGSVLTTEVINWARTSVRECDLARRLVHYAVHNHTLPKHVERRLLLLRDEKLTPQGRAALDRLADEIRDHNYRIFAEDELLHLISSGLHLQAGEPFEMLDELLATNPKNLDASHAFYLGFELAKAHTALVLGKQYRQDEALDWGFLTRPEVSRRERRRVDRDG